jgi:hypothetical protein
MWTSLYRIMDPHFFIFCAAYISKSGPGDCQSPGYSLRISASKIAVAVEVDFVEPVMALGKFLNRQRIHWLDKANLGRREGAVCPASFNLTSENLLYPAVTGLFVVRFATVNEVAAKVSAEKHGRNINVRIINRKKRKGLTPKPGNPSELFIMAFLPKKARPGSDSASKIFDYGKRVTASSTREKEDSFDLR